MIGMIRQALKNRRIDTTAPPLLGPDRAPTYKQSEDNPLFAFYAPDGLYYPPMTKPLQPGGPGGPQNFNSDCARQPQAMWNRAPDGMSAKDIVRVLQHTGLDHL